MWDEAEAELKSLVSRGELDADSAHEFRMQILMGQRRYDDLLKACGRRPDRRDWVRASIAHAKLGDVDRAKVFAEKAEREQLPYADVAMSQVLEASGDLVGALDCIESTRQWGYAADQWLASGRLLAALGECGEARVALFRAARFKSFLDPEIMDRLADCSWRLGDSAGAERAVELAKKARVA